MTNSITLFSNGIGHFSRSYVVSKEADKKISIPFKKEHIGDVAASLQVFGKVKLSSPPSFTPSNSDSTHLNIDQKNALRSLLQSLSGAEIEICSAMFDNKYTYTLLGIEQDKTVFADNSIGIKDVVIVMSEGCKVKRIPFEEIETVNFTEEAVQQEISKALKKNFQQIKPDSTFLDLVLESLDENGSEAMVQYTIPVAAWKMRYSIREEDGSFYLEGAAVIDNNTDEDWNESLISVVTGNPISFNTDIATVVIPHRKTINLVESRVLGNARVSSPLDESYNEGNVKKGTRGGLRSAAGPKMSVSNYANFGFSAGDDSSSCHVDRGMMENMAEAPGVDTKEVGDFSIFTSKEPVTILARKSAVVPMFNVKLDKVGTVLFYKESYHARRPYRAVKFKNGSDFTLNRGKTTIYNGGVFSGECVLETTKPGENRTLPHCLENGVKIVKELKGSTTTLSQIKISEGVTCQETVHVARTDYVIVNKKDEEFKVHIEHENIYKDSIVSSEGAEVEDVEKVEEGNRFFLKIKPKESVTLSVIERLADSESWSVSGGWTWIRTNVIGKVTDFDKNEHLKKCISIQEEIDNKSKEMSQCRSQQQYLQSQVERVRKNLEAAKDVGGEMVKGSEQLSENLTNSIFFFSKIVGKILHIKRGNTLC